MVRFTSFGPGPIFLLVSVTILGVLQSGAAFVPQNGYKRGESGEPDVHRRVHHAPGRKLPTSRALQAVEDSDHWYNSAQESIRAKLSTPRIETQAKNLILFIGDGMGLSTVTASRIFKGQREGAEFGGEETRLHMDTFPFVGASKTYCSNSQVGDSACSSTAYFGGTKGNAATLGVTPAVAFNDCMAQMNTTNHVSTILAWAQAAGMSTGIVTTTAITEASPAGSYAHIANRDWENDRVIEEHGWNPNLCDDIAEQLVLRQPGQGINVILGGGRENFYDRTLPDVEFPTQFGQRTDGRNLVQEWLRGKEARNQTAKYLTGRDELLSLNTTGLDYLMGLFAPYHTSYTENQAANNDPTLEEMTAVALEILTRNPNGFFLFVEGGRIDHAHHGNQAQRAMLETLQFDEAIKYADEVTNDEDTLLVVSSDHSHLLTIAGDPVRGNPILGLSGTIDGNQDGLPYTTLGYINGPGYRPAVYDQGTGTCMRVDVGSDDVEGITYQQAAQVPRGGSTHAGEDVLIFAKGPWAHLLTGINEQNFIPHVMGYAGCISPFEHNFCGQRVIRDKKEQ